MSATCIQAAALHVLVLSMGQKELQSGSERGATSRAIVLPEHPASTAPRPAGLSASAGNSLLGRPGHQAWAQGEVGLAAAMSVVQTVIIAIFIFLAGYIFKMKLFS